MFGMQQLKAPFCFCCALALSSSLICIFLQGKNCFLLFVGVWDVAAWSELRFLPLVGWCSSDTYQLVLLGSRTRPDPTRSTGAEQENGGFPAGPDCSHTALNFKCDGCWRNLPATLLSAKPKAFHLALAWMSSYPKVWGLATRDSRKTAFEDSVGPLTWKDLVFKV